MKKGIIFTLVLCMILCLCACGTAETPANPETPAENPAQTTGTETPATSEKPLELVIITQSWDNIFFVQMRDAALAYAEKLDNVNVTVMAGADINEQLKLMEDFTVQKPGLLLRRFRHRPRHRDGYGGRHPRVLPGQQLHRNGDRLLHRHG